MAGYDLQKTIPALERSIAFFRPHHLELRSRLIKVFATIAIFTAAAYIFAENIAQLFIKPLFAASPLMHRLVYTNLPEAFIAYIKLALLLGLICSMPIVLYQMWAFISPGLKSEEKKFTVTVVFWSTLLFFSGVFFAYFAVLPQMLHYLMSYANEGLEPLPKLGKYLVFVGRTLLTFGLAFQIPFLMTMTARAGFIRTTYFRDKRFYFYIAIIILSFMLTAGDFMATVLLAIPLFLLYEAGIFLGRLFSKKKDINNISAA